MSQSGGGGLELVPADGGEGAALFGAEAGFDGVAADEGEGIQEGSEGVAGDHGVGVGGGQAEWLHAAGGAQVGEGVEGVGLPADGGQAGHRGGLAVQAGLVGQGGDGFDLVPAEQGRNPGQGGVVEVDRVVVDQDAGVELALVGGGGRQRQNRSGTGRRR